MAKLFLTLTVMCVFGAVVVEGIDNRVLQIFSAQVNTCKEEGGANDVNVLELMQDSTNYSMQAKCLLACIMRKTNLMADNGKFVEGAALTYVKNHAGNNDALLKIAEEIINICAPIEVDDNQCEAAVQYAECFKHELKARNIH